MRIAGKTYGVSNRVPRQLPLRQRRVLLAFLVVHTFIVVAALVALATLHFSAAIGFVLAFLVVEWVENFVRRRWGIPVLPKLWQRRRQHEGGPA
jgi:hypothetical protein